MAKKFIESPLHNAPCPICQGKNYMWGNLNYEVSFRPYTEEKGFLAQLSVHPIVMKPLDRLCKDCGNIQTFVERK